MLFFGVCFFLNVYKICQICKAIFSTVYDISQPNFAILVNLGCSFKLCWYFCLFRFFSKFCLKGERSIQIRDFKNGVYGKRQAWDTPFTIAINLLIVKCLVHGNYFNDRKRRPETCSLIIEARWLMWFCLHGFTFELWRLTFEFYNRTARHTQSGLLQTSNDNSDVKRLRLWTIIHRWERFGGHTNIS